jgi:hypothetical protein
MWMMKYKLKFGVYSFKKNISYFRTTQFLKMKSMQKILLYFLFFCVIGGGQISADECAPPILDTDLNIDIPCVGIAGEQYSARLVYKPPAWEYESHTPSDCQWQTKNCATLTDTWDLTLPNFVWDNTSQTALLKFDGTESTPLRWLYQKHFKDNAEQSGFSYHRGTLAAAQTTADGASGKKLLAIYMVGSDLEGKYGFGTKDLNELIRGYNVLPDKEAIQVVVAFGGAKNWQGMRYATIDQILTDSVDNEFGNETGDNAYLYNEPRAVMGDKSALTHFLTFLQDNYSNMSPRFLTFWDHGNAYLGYGKDQNNKMDAMSLTELHDAFNNSGVEKFDLIGFDACLMASLEVANFMRHHGHYLLASQEEEPGHGWNWEEVIQRYANNADIIEAGKNMVDNFVNNETHGRKRSGKTLSIVDLSQFANMLTQLNTFADTMITKINGGDQTTIAAINAALNIYEGAESYGKHGSKRYEFDLKQFVTLMGGAESEPLIQAINNYVIHANNDGTRQNANGVSLLALSHNSFLGDKMIAKDFTLNFKGHEINLWENLYVSESVWQLHKAIHALAQGDTQAPIVQNQVADTKAGEVLSLDAASPLAEATGVLATFTDDNLTTVRTIFGGVKSIENEDNQLFLSVGAVQAMSTDTKGQYFAPAWNGQWYVIEYDSEENPVWMPLAFENKYTDESGQVLTVYTAEVQFIRKVKDEVSTVGFFGDLVELFGDEAEPFPDNLAELEITFDADNQAVAHQVRPYQVIHQNEDDKRGHLAPGKETFEIQANDEIRFLSTWLKFSSTGEIIGARFYPTTFGMLAVTQTPVFSFTDITLEDDEGDEMASRYVMAAEDASGNITLTVPMGVK